MGKKYIFWRTGFGFITGILVFILSLLIPLSLSIFMIDWKLVVIISVITIVLLIYLANLIDASFIKQQKTDKNTILNMLIKYLGIPFLFTANIFFFLIIFSIVIHHNSHSKKNRAKIYIKNMFSALQHYESEYNNYPDKLEDLVKKKILAEVPLDPFRNDYIYINNESNITIISKGKDGIINSDDDISLTKEK